MTVNKKLLLILCAALLAVAVLTFGCASILSSANTQAAYTADGARLLEQHTEMLSDYLSEASAHAETLAQSAAVHAALAAQHGTTLAQNGGWTAVCGTAWEPFLLLEDGTVIAAERTALVDTTLALPKSELQRAQSGAAVTDLLPALYPGAAPYIGVVCALQGGYLLLAHRADTLLQDGGRLLPAHDALLTFDRTGNLLAAYGAPTFSSRHDLRTAANCTYNRLTEGVHAVTAPTGERYWAIGRSCAASGGMVFLLLARDTNAPTAWQIVLVVLLMLGGIGAVLAALLRVLEQTYIQPMKMLLEGADAVLAETKDAILPFVRNKDLNRLGVAFNKLIERLRDARRDLSISEQRLRVRQEQTEGITFETELASGQVECSENARRLAGYPACLASFPDTLIDGGNVAPEHVDELRALAHAAVESRTAQEMQLLLRVRDGTFRWYQLHLCTVRDAQTFKPLRVMGQLVDIDADKRAIEQLTSRAERDSMTKLYNKATIHEMISLRLTQQVSTQGSALYVLDLDNFKRVNDTYGHQKGDAVLIETAQTLLRCARAQSKESIVGRIGGDEFMAFYPNLNTYEDAAVLGRELVSALGHLVLDEETDDFISASVGIALCPRDGATLDVLYACADEALYSVKALGKKAFAFYDKDALVSAAASEQESV